MSQLTDKTLEKYEQWRKTGGPPYLTDKELLTMLDRFNQLMMLLRGMKEYVLAMRAVESEWDSLSRIATARNLEVQQFGRRIGS